MANQLFNLMNNMPQMNGNVGQMQNLINQFNQFRSTFRGNPQQLVQMMLQNGQITQPQIDQLAPMATQLYNAMNKR